MTIPFPQNLAKWAIATFREGIWAPSLVFAVHSVAAIGFDAYQRLPQLDVFTHFIGGTAIAFFLSRAFLNGSRFGIIGAFHPVTHVVLVASSTCAAAVVWEFAEFVIDRTFGTRHQDSVADTMADLFLGVAGGVSFLAACGVIGRLWSDPPGECGRADGYLGGDRS